jgi:hypothetical protein
LAGRTDFQKALQEIDMTIIYKLYTAREDFSTLQEEFPRLQTVQSFDELGTIFAHETQAPYITDINTLRRTIEQL